MLSLGIITATDVACRQPHDVTTSTFVNTIRYDSGYLTCSKKMMGSQLSLPHGINKKLKRETKHKMIILYQSTVLNISTLPFARDSILFFYVSVRVLDDTYKYHHVCNESTVSYAIRL